MISPGIYPDISADSYFADPAPAASLSNSLILPLLNQSPRHAWLAHPKLNPNYRRREDQVFDVGRTAHAMLLEDLDIACVIDADDWRTKAAREQRDAAREAGKVPLLTHQYVQVAAMVNAAKLYIEGTQLAGLFARGTGEQTMLWKVDDTWCRALIDWLVEDRTLVVDYKTTAAECPEAWIRGHMLQHGYDTQADFTRRGLAYHGHANVRFLFLVQETCEPYMCYLVEPAATMYEVAAGKCTRAVALWAQCMKHNRWPGYSKEVYQADAPIWAVRDEESQA